MNPVLAIIIASLIWGAAPPVFKFALTEIPPFTLAFIRFFFAGLIFLPFIQGKKGLDRKTFMNVAAGSFWGIIVNITFFFFGLKVAPSINVHVFSAIGPIVLYLLSIFMLKEKPHPQVMKGILLSFAGVLLIVLAPLYVNANFMDPQTHPITAVIIGNVFFIISMFGAVFHTIYNKKALKKGDPQMVTFWSFMIGAIAFFVPMVYELQYWSFSNLELRSWTGIIFGVFFSSALAYFLHNYALARLNVQKFGIFTYLEPPVAVLVAIPLLHEYPDIFFIFGSVLVFAGIYISQRHPHFKKIRNKG